MGCSCRNLYGQQQPLRASPQHINTDRHTLKPTERSQSFPNCLRESKREVSTSKMGGSNSVSECVNSTIYSNVLTVLHSHFDHAVPEK